MIYRVHVDCWYTVPRYGDFLEARFFLVEADNSSAAQHRATALAEETAACSHTLAAVEFRSATLIAPPLEIVGGAKFATPSAFRKLRIPRRVHAKIARRAAVHVEVHVQEKP